MNHIFFLDLETYSSIPIKNGVYKYAEKAEILLFAYALDNNSVKVWDCKTAKIPEDLRQILKRKDTVWCAHNSQFDRVILEKILGIRYPYWIDTMVMARQHSLPGKLSDLCDFFQLPTDKAKDKKGKSLIQLFSKPLGKNRKLNRANKLTHPTEWEEFITYASSDIIAMREILQKIPKWNFTSFERNAWNLDQIINNRGMAVDVDFAIKAIELLNIEKQRYNRDISILTKKEIKTTQQIDKIINWIRNNYDITIPDLQASTVRTLLDTKLPKGVKKILELRAISSKTSVKKYSTLLSATNKDSRLRGTLLFCGAHRTGRWSGRVFQPQNLPRPKFKNEEIENYIKNIKSNSLMHSDINKVCSSSIRGLIIPSKGNKLVVSDYSSIEGRVLAWLAGEEWKIKAYEKIDKGEGFDMYELTYANTFNVNPSTVTKEQRSLGKILELALGYQGGAGAFAKFAKNFNIDLQDIVTQVDIPARVMSEAENFFGFAVKNNMVGDLTYEEFTTCDSIKRIWREKNSNIVQMWSDLHNTVKLSIQCRQNNIAGYCTINHENNYLRIKLPSGRYLCYPLVCIDEKQNIRYFGKDQYSRKWAMLYTYGGKLAENITQAVARDILVYGMFNAEKKGYKIVLTVHDELITDVPDKIDFSHEDLSRCISVLPKWTHGLPLSAEGFECYRYQKQ